MIAEFSFFTDYPSLSNHVKRKYDCVSTRLFVLLESGLLILSLIFQGCCCFFPYTYTILSSAMVVLNLNIIGKV